MEFLCTINCKVFVCKNWSKPFDLSTLIFPVATYIQICRQMSEEQSRTGKNVQRFYLFKWDIICMHTFSRSRVVKFWLKMICVNYKKKNRHLEKVTLSYDPAFRRTLGSKAYKRSLLWSLILLLFSSRSLHILNPTALYFVIYCNNERGGVSRVKTRILNKGLLWPWHRYIMQGQCNSPTYR